MRVIQTCTFRLSAKIPFSDYPAIVHRFLEDQKLTSHRFLYYFDELVDQKEFAEKLSTGSCAKAVKDCPALGEIRINKSQAYPKFFLSNIDRNTGCTEADMLPHMKKIHRKYGFCESSLFYYDIDFFNKVIPFERDMSHVEIREKATQSNTDSTVFLNRQPYGSGIKLQRYSAGGNEISLSIDLLHDGNFFDATQYFEGMKTLLPSTRPYISMKVYLTEDEQQRIAYWNEQIIPLVDQSRSFFAEHCPTKDRQNVNSSHYTVAPKLKKLAKLYGFSYDYKGCGFYTLDKRTARGHVLHLSVDSGPSHYDTTYLVDILGIGFCHRICTSMQTPCNQAESDASAEMIFSALSKFEKNLLEQFDEFYDATPDWFVPFEFSF